VKKGSEGKERMEGEGKKKNLLVTEKTWTEEPQGWCQDSSLSLASALCSEDSALHLISLAAKGDSG
jgi:hypothetical protein